MFEVIEEGQAPVARPKPATPSLARTAEFQAAITNTIQAMRNVPAILHALDIDELRQLSDAAQDLVRATDLAADILIASRFAADQAGAL